MTDSPTLPGDGHLDDEALSAVLDGEGTAAEAAHAESCPACAARLGILRDASVLVAAPVPAGDPARRDAAIAAALAAADGGSRTVTTLRPRRRALPTWLGAAAAVLVVVAAFAFIGRAGDDDDARTASDDAALDAGGTAGGGDDALADESMSTLAAPVTVDGGDLGAIDVGGLHDRIESALGASQRETAADGDTAVQTPGPGAAAGTNPAAAGPAPCETEVRGVDESLGALLYRATGTLNEEPVVVLGFGVGDTDRRVYVLSVDGCTIRNSQSYSA